jgi:hypothetical protein
LSNYKDYIMNFGVIDARPAHSAAYAKLRDVRQQVMALLRQADSLASEIRADARIMDIGKVGWEVDTVNASTEPELSAASSEIL